MTKRWSSSSGGFFGSFIFIKMPLMSINIFSISRIALGSLVFFISTNSARKFLYANITSLHCLQTLSALETKSMISFLSSVNFCRSFIPPPICFKSVKAEIRAPPPPICCVGSVSPSMYFSKYTLPKLMIVSFIVVL